MVLNLLLPEIIPEILDFLSIYELIDISSNLNSSTYFLDFILHQKINNNCKKISNENINDFFIMEKITKDCEKIGLYSINYRRKNIKLSIIDFLKKNKNLETNYDKIININENNHNNVIFTEINEKKEEKDLIRHVYSFHIKDYRNLEIYYLIDGKKSIFIVNS
jgi:hypothetical protein